MMKWINKLIIGCCTILFVACSTDSEPQLAEEDTMRLCSAARSGTGTENKCVLLFWEYLNFEDIASNLPFCVAKPSGDIDAYKTDPYDTKQKYPKDDNIVAVAGYSPQNLVSSKLPGNRANYVTLSLPEGSVGATTDLMTSIKPVYGSASDPFDKRGKEPLRFMHAQSKVTLNARLSNDMDLFIKQVQITFPQGTQTGSLKWDQTQSKYIAQKATAGYTLKQADETVVLKKGTDTEIGTLFVLPELTSFTVEITALKSDTEGFVTSKPTKFKTNLSYQITRDPSSVETDKGKEINKLYAGESYIFTLVFGKKDIELVGKKCPWGEGGTITLPIYPVRPKP